MEITNLNIAFVEDDADDITNIAISLKLHRAFVKVSHYWDGEQLLEYLNAYRSNLPSVILTDLNMPRKDGYEILAAIARDKDFSKIPVIVYTTSSSAYCFTKCKDLGATHVLVKPFDFKKIHELPEQLLAILQTL